MSSAVKMSVKPPPTQRLNHCRKTICGEDNSPAFLRWWAIANTWCQKNRAELPPDHHPITNPALGLQVNTETSPARISAKLPYYRESEQKVTDWPKSVPNGVELSDNGIFWAMLTEQDRLSSRWSKDFDWAGRLHYERTPKGPPVVFHHQGWWVPVIGRFYALIGEDANHSWLVNPEYPFQGLKQWEDQNTIYIGLVVPSGEMLKKAVVYTMSDIPQEFRANIRIARYRDDLALWLEGNSLVKLSDARDARAENVGNSTANIILPSNITLWSLTGNETDCSFKVNKYYVKQKNTIKIKLKSAEGEDDGPVDMTEKDDDNSHERSMAVYDRSDLKLLAPLMDEKFRPFLPLIADVRHTKSLVSESLRKHSRAKDAMADAVHGLEPNDQMRILEFAGFTSEDLTHVQVDCTDV